MPQIPPTYLPSREYSGANNKASPKTDGFQPRQLEAAHKQTTKTETTPTSISANPKNQVSSFIATTERYLQQTGGALERLKALSIRSASDNSSDSDRKNANEDAEELVSLIDKIASTASFDGKQILDGSIGAISLQASLSPATVKSIQGFDASASALGAQPGNRQVTSNRVQLQSNSPGNQGIQEGDAKANIISSFSIFVEGREINKTINIADQRFGGLLHNIADSNALADPTHRDYGAGIAKDIANRVNSLRDLGAASLAKVYATAQTTFGAEDISTSDFSGKVDSSQDTFVGLGSIDKGDLSINGVDVDQVAFLQNDAAGTLVYAINAISGLTGVTATTDSITGELALEASDGRDIIIDTSTIDATNLIFGGGQSRFSDIFSNLRISGRVTFSADENLHITGASKALAGFNEFSLDSTEGNKFTADTIADTDLTTSDNANSAIDNIDRAIDQVNTFSDKLSNLRREIESSLKAVGNIYGSTSKNTTDATDSSNASRLAELSRSLIQQRIDTAIQAQANGTPQQVLYYLR